MEGPGSVADVLRFVTFAGIKFLGQSISPRKVSVQTEESQGSLDVHELLLKVDAIGVITSLES